MKDKPIPTIYRIGSTFGSLTVISVTRTPKTEKKRAITLFVCRCVCKTIKTIPSSSVISGSTKSCGCLKFSLRKHKHGMSQTEIYKIWQGMKYRCRPGLNPVNRSYIERGIKVCDRWEDKENGFMNFLSDMGLRPSDKHSIDRINNDLGYFPENCKWSTDAEQMSNRSITVKLSHNGETKCVSEWARDTGISTSTLFGRVYQGWDDEKILTTPPKDKNRKIIDRKTGCIYPSIKAAAVAFRLKHLSLGEMLRGKCKNKTTLAYL